MQLNRGITAAISSILKYVSLKRDAARSAFDDLTWAGWFAENEESD